MKFSLISESHQKQIKDWLPELGNFYDGHDSSSKFFNQIANKNETDPFGYFTLKKEIWTATDNSELLGFICLNYKRGGSVKIGPLMVNPKHRGKGVGKFLIQSSIKQTKETNVRKLYATTSSLNNPASNLFESCSFEKEAELPDQYKTGASEYIWGLFLQENPTRQKGNNSFLIKTKSNSGTTRNYCDKTDRGFLAETVDVMSEWHDGLDSDFIKGLIEASERDLDYEIKGKKIMTNEQEGKIKGLAVTTPKRGGPVKLYPIYGTKTAQKQLADSIKAFYSQCGYRKIYTFTPASDHQHILFLKSIGFSKRGIIKAPYKNGFDLVVLDVFI